MIEIDDQYIKKRITPRREDAHKGDLGKILIFAGSVGMAGAAVLCGRAALKSGAGLVQYLLTDFDTPLLPILQISVPEATCVRLTHRIKWSEYSAIAAGSGLGFSRQQSGPEYAHILETRKVLSSILDACDGTLVLDADALNMIAADEDLAEQVRSSRAQIIMTPHVGEARRLLHTTQEIRSLESRKQAVCTLARQYHCIAVLKGAGTLVSEEVGCVSSAETQPEEISFCISHKTADNSGIAAADSETQPENEQGSCPADSGPDINKRQAEASFCLSCNTTGNPGMATGGSGDSLAGLIASLAAQGYTPLDAARMGVFLHGKAGDLAAAQLGQMGMTSSDLVSFLPAALKLYEK